MGWNTSALFVEGRTAEQILPSLPDVFSYEPTGQRVTADEAWAGSPGSRLYLATHDDWCQIWDPDQRFAPRLGALMEADDQGALRQATALAVLFSGVTSTYGFWLFQDGELVRHAMFESGQCTAEQGEPLPVEEEIAIPSWGHDEDFLWGIIQKVTGLSGSVDDMFDIYRVL